MAAIQHADLESGLSVPRVNAAVGRAGEHKFGVRREAPVDGNALVVEMSGERLHRVAVEGVEQSHHASVRRQEDEFAMRGKAEARPLAFGLARHLEMKGAILMIGLDVLARVPLSDWPKDPSDVTQL